MRYLLINTICGFLSENLFILRLQIYIKVTKNSWDSKTLVSLNVRSRQFKKSYLSGGLYKIPVKTGLDLGRKISIKILSINAKIRFPII